MSETDLPVLAALAEVQPPPGGSAGAAFLRAAWRSGAGVVPDLSDDEVWAAWVDLQLWRRSRVPGPVDLTAHARTDLAVVAGVLGQASVPEQDPVRRAGLTGEQDARLRTLAALRELGELSPELQELRRAFRERDQRAVVRPPGPVSWPGAGRPPTRS